MIATATVAPCHKINKTIILNTSFSFRKQRTDQSIIDTILTLNGYTKTKKRDEARNNKLVELVYLNISIFYLFISITNYIIFDLICRFRPTSYYVYVHSLPYSTSFIVTH